MITVYLIGEIIQVNERQINIKFLTESYMLKGILFWLKWHCKLIILYGQFIRYKEEII